MLLAQKTNEFGEFDTITRKTDNSSELSEKKFHSHVLAAVDVNLRAIHV
jgi:hypothetical protein